jgi:hypothetical protein
MTAPITTTVLPAAADGLTAQDRARPVTGTATTPDAAG